MKYFFIIFMIVHSVLFSSDSLRLNELDLLTLDSFSLEELNDIALFIEKSDVEEEPLRAIIQRTHFYDFMFFLFVNKSKGNSGGQLVDMSTPVLSTFEPNRIDLEKLSFSNVKDVFFRARLETYKKEYEVELRRYKKIEVLMKIRVLCISLLLHKDRLLPSSLFLEKNLNFYEVETFTSLKLEAIDKLTFFKRYYLGLRKWRSPIVKRFDFKGIEEEQTSLLTFQEIKERLKVSKLYINLANLKYLRSRVLEDKFTAEELLFFIQISVRNIDYKLYLFESSMLQNDLIEFRNTVLYLLVNKNFKQHEKDLIDFIGEKAYRLRFIEKTPCEKIADLNYFETEEKLRLGE